MNDPLVDAFAPEHNMLCAADGPCIPTRYTRGKSGLSRVEISLLSYVLETPPAKQGGRNAIALECECAPNSIPRAAKKLEALGLIEREVSKVGGRTSYKVGRNMEVTGRNSEVARNVEVATIDASRLRTTDSDTPTETTTTGGGVTALQGGRNNPPLEPPKDTHSVSEASSEPAESKSVGRSGELFDPPPRKSRRKAKLVASDETMPREPSAKMLEHAAKNQFVNGTVARMFERWRDHHIERGTLIADHEASWRKWVNNAVEFRSRDAAKAKPGITSAGIGADGKQRFNRKRTYYAGV